MAAVTWIGDSDPGAQVITQAGITFVKGEPVDVTDKSVLAKLAGNPLFSTEKDAKPAEADEPEAPDPDAGTERAALREQLRGHGVVMKGNPSPDTMRARLAKAIAGEAHDD